MLELNFHPFPTLETERLILRKITLDDAPDFFLSRSDKETMKYICKPLHKTLADTEKLINEITDGIEKNTFISWAIALKEDNKQIGTIGYHRILPEHYRAEVGYMIARPHWKKGIAGEALTAVLHFGFTHLKFHSIEAKIDPHNAASANILKRHAFVKEAYFKEDYFYEGKFLDTEIYSLLAPRSVTGK